MTLPKIQCEITQTVPIMKRPTFASHTMTFFAHLFFPSAPPSTIYRWALGMHVWPCVHTSIRGECVLFYDGIISHRIIIINMLRTRIFHSQSNYLFHVFISSSCLAHVIRLRGPCNITIIIMNHSFINHNKLMDQNLLSSASIVCLFALFAIPLYLSWVMCGVAHPKSETR